MLAVCVSLCFTEDKHGSVKRCVVKKHYSFDGNTKKDKTPPHLLFSSNKFSLKKQLKKERNCIATLQTRKLLKIGENGTFAVAETGEK